MSRWLLAGATLTAACVIGATVVTPAPALAAGEQVGIWLTTTTDTGGRSVSRGLEQQSPVQFAPGSEDATHTITVDENTTYQRFEGAGAAITDTTAHLLRGGAVSERTRAATMRELFDPDQGIGLSFVRNPIGASDLSRPGNVSLDDTCCDLGDFATNGYDDDVLELTKQAASLNPELTVKAVPWSSPGWMKDNGRMDQMGWLKWEYYPTYAQYLVKYLQRYQAAGVPVRYLSVQNEPNCCQAGNPTAMNYPGMNWNPDGLVEFTKNHVYPALHAAGLDTKVLVHDWNYGDYANFGSGVLDDAGIRSDSAFGGIAWHGYGGDPATGSQVHDQYPGVRQFSTEHSGGTWVSNQHNDDMSDIVNYTRNWSSSVVKWSLAVNQGMGPHNGGCGTCTGLITVQEGGDRAGQVDKTIEYYTTGHLTKFVRPGAVRIDSTADDTVQNVAWRNPDDSKALIAHNGSGNAKSVKVEWANQSFTYELPARTTATFTWPGAPGVASARTAHNSAEGQVQPVLGTRPQPRTTPAAAALPEGFRSVGYLPSWAGNTDAVQYTKLTNVNYAFALPNPDGSLQPIENTDKLRSLVSRGHGGGVSVSLAVGGWNDGDDSAFEALAANADTRTRFVDTVMSTVEQYDLDGIDIDWEYPDPGTSGDNFAALMAELGTALHDAGKILTAAVVSGGDTAEGVQPGVFDDVDWLNIMAYDGGEPHANYDWSIASAESWQNRGLPAKKTVLGLPFYSRPGYLPYSQLVAADPANADRDCTTADGTEQCYNGLPTVRNKTSWAVAHAGGVMNWELSQDTGDGTSLVGAIFDTASG